MTTLPEAIPCFRCGLLRRVYYRSEAEGLVQRAHYGCGCGVRFTAAGSDKATEDAAKADLLQALRQAWARGRDAWNAFAAGQGAEIAKQDELIDKGEPVLREDGAAPLTEADRQQVTMEQMDLGITERRSIRDIPDRKAKAYR